MTKMENKKSRRIEAEWVKMRNRKRRKEKEEEEKKTHTHAAAAGDGMEKYDCDKKWMLEEMMNITKYHLLHI